MPSMMKLYTVLLLLHNVDYVIMPGHIHDNFIFFISNFKPNHDFVVSLLSPPISLSIFPSSRDAFQQFKTPLIRCRELEIKIYFANHKNHSRIMTTSKEFSLTPLDVLLTLFIQKKVVKHISHTFFIYS